MAWLADVPRLVGRPLGGLVGGAGPFALAQLRSAWIVVPTREDADHWVRALRYFGEQTIEQRQGMFGDQLIELGAGRAPQL